MTCPFKVAHGGSVAPAIAPGRLTERATRRPAPAPGVRRGLAPCRVTHAGDSLVDCCPEFAFMEYQQLTKAFDAAGALVMPGEGENGRGLFASRDVAAGEALMSVPIDATLPVIINPADFRQKHTHATQARLGELYASFAERYGVALPTSVSLTDSRQLRRRFRSSPRNDCERPPLPLILPVIPSMLSACLRGRCIPGRVAFHTWYRLRGLCGTGRHQTRGRAPMDEVGERGVAAVDRVGAGIGG